MFGTYLMVKIERLSESEGYQLHLLPEGKDFRESDSYETIRASWLKVNGVGFSTEACEFSEHEEKIAVSQETEGGSAKLTVPA